jgi:hypothetical protein
MKEMTGDLTRPRGRRDLTSCFDFLPGAESGRDFTNSTFALAALG